MILKFFKKWKLMILLIQLYLYQDEVEPLADRLNIIKILKNTTCIFAVSQMSLTTIIRYKMIWLKSDKTKLNLNN